MSTALFSVAPDYYRAAVAELRREFPDGTVRRVGEDAGLIELRDAPGDPAATSRLADAALDGRTRFVRHIAAVDAQTTSAALPSDADGVADWALAAVDARLEPGDEITLHVWDSGPDARAPGKVRTALREGLLDAGVRVVTTGATRTLSLCLGVERTTVGLGNSDDALIDWAGGRIRLAARPEQISRAEFKLEELFSLIGNPPGHSAIDLGASPGGWTRILRDRGFEVVHAVDPAQLDERLADDQGVHHHRTTAGEFIQEALAGGVAGLDGPVDLIVNDMRMVPHLTAKTMVDAVGLLRRDGFAVVTFKLGVNNPGKQADESLDLLSQAYEATFVRQLQHNRQELTVVARPL